MTAALGRVGIWCASFAWGEDAQAAAAEAESLGYGALWIGSAAADLELAGRLLAATGRITVATGIVNVWAAEPGALAAAWHRLDVAHPGRFLLGVGIGHAMQVEAAGGRYEKPITRLTGFLDGLDAATPPVPNDRRVLAALGPKALDLAALRSAGAHPYLVTPEYTAQARGRLGDGPLLVPDHKVVLDTDPARARALARKHLHLYLQLPNYLRNLRAQGFTDDDLAGGGSDRLVDALYAWGSPQRIAQRIAEHVDAGADQVAVQVVPADYDPATRTGSAPVAAWRELAPVLLNAADTGRRA